MNNPLLIKNFVAEADIAPYRICKFGVAGGTAVQAAGATDAMFAVSDSLGGKLNGRVDLMLYGPVNCEYGGTIAPGDLLTSDAQGRAVAAAPAAGANARIIGIADVSGVLGDIGSVILAPGQIQG